MVRILVNMSNGLCGCDEDFILSFDREDVSDDEIWVAACENYSYFDGFAGCENYEEEAEEGGYDSVEEYCMRMAEEYSTFEEITEEEYRNYIDEGLDEVILC